MIHRLSRRSILGGMVAVPIGLRAARAQTREQYEAFIAALANGEPADGHEWDRVPYFEGCLPIEEIARRGPETLRFGPMKPVGLWDPNTGKLPYAVLQLRQENLRADSYYIVGFQNHM